MYTLTDRFGRVIRDLRISVTDRCNFRCSYCMPAGYVPRPQRDILSFEEIVRLVTLCLPLGVQKVRLSGGEPLVRRDTTDLVAGLARLPGLQDLAMTTNGHFLQAHLSRLHRAGLQRLNISLDSLQRDRFHAMTGVDGLPTVLNAIEAASSEGFAPLKINCVAVRHQNEDELVDFASFARKTGHTVRFIEFMPLDSARAWDRSLVVGGQEILARIQSRYPLVRLPARQTGETALRYGFADGNPGEIGIVAPVTMPFCGQCNRLRVTADGKIKTCLFSLQEHDIKTPMRSGASDAELRALLMTIVMGKEKGHRINEPDFTPPERTMSCIGG